MAISIDYSKCMGVLTKGGMQREHGILSSRFGRSCKQLLFTAHEFVKF